MMDLSRSMVQVLGPKGDVAGAGFLVADDLVLTTSHAVRDPDPQDRPEVSFELIPAGGAAGTAPVITADPPHLGSVVVAFPHVRGRIATATVIPPESGQPNGLTLLRLRRMLNDSVAAELGKAPAEGAVQLAGFARRQSRARSDDAIRTAQGRLGPAGSDGLWRIGELGDVPDMVPGGPLVDAATGAVIGVVTEFEAPRPDLGRPARALAQPIASLTQAFPQLDTPKPGLGRRIHHPHVLAGVAGAAVLVVAVAAVAVLRPAPGQHQVELSRRLVTQSATVLDGDPLKPLLIATALGYSPTTQALTLAHRLLAVPSARLDGHKGRVNSLSFSPDGTTLASAGADGTTRLWDVRAHRQRGGPIVEDGPLQDVVTSVAFSPNGRYLATSQFSGWVRIRAAGTLQPAGPRLRGLASETRADEVTSLAFSPDSRTLAVAGVRGIARLWDTATRRTEGAPLQDRGYVSIQSLAFSPDGRLLATGISDGRIQLWDVAERRPIAPALLTGTSAVLSVAFSLDGRLLAAANGRGLAILWNVVTHQPQRVLTESGGAVGALSFSPDGETVATGDQDGTVRLWDTSTGRQRGPALYGGTDGVRAIQFSPDHLRLAAAGDNGVVRVWDLGGSPDYARSGAAEDGPAQLISGLCEIAGRAISRDEWLTRLPDEPYRNVCPGLHD